MGNLAKLCLLFLLLPLFGLVGCETEADRQAKVARAATVAAVDAETKALEASVAAFDAALGSTVVTEKGVSAAHIKATLERLKREPVIEGGAKAKASVQMMAEIDQALPADGSLWRERVSSKRVKALEAARELKGIEQWSASPWVWEAGEWEKAVGEWEKTAQAWQTAADAWAAAHQAGE